MITTDISIQVAESVDEAINYNEMENPPTPIIITQGLVVPEGMKSGDPTIDLICRDPEGNEFLIMTSYGIIATLAQALHGVREMDKEQVTRKITTKVGKGGTVISPFDGKEITIIDIHDIGIAFNHPEDGICSRRRDSMTEEEALVFWFLRREKN